LNHRMTTVIDSKCLQSQAMVCYFMNKSLRHNVKF